ncbi:DUF4147 domain-containing protein [Halocatena marina]|uniref:DUF4147 domain-containing protein n=1 Tax=Halocatena marina TaxID=2934937 RepID=A0ABD5YZT7_9EURY|nr:DUF4147 domain-containing protein [Halocatena marina]
MIGNDLSTAGSGPSVPDETTYQGVLSVFERFEFTSSLAVCNHLETGVTGEHRETLFPDDSVFDT